ncbi:Hypothetical predicted protein [Cloeon dipterum]|uniref:Uncharacterized protein n=1 Tax=Cloeon dipterum TaxID=197152 RepID=A0A8S1DUT1_9INSE|nr:Hypothetical predicted protein [Cloeon dipterum]
MEQLRTNTATCVIPMQSEASNTPGSKPNHVTLEFATKIPLKFDPLVAADNSQNAAIESDSSMFKKISVFLLVLITCSFYNVLGLIVFVFSSSSPLNHLAAFFGVLISDLLLWPIASSILSDGDYSFFFNCVLYSGFLGLLCIIFWYIYETKSAENAIQQQNNPNDVNNGNIL